MKKFDREFSESECKSVSELVQKIVKIPSKDSNEN